jgi:hypothetical protein
MHGPPDRDSMALAVASAYAAMFDGQLPEAGDLVANLLRQIDRDTAPPAKVPAGPGRAPRPVRRPAGRRGAVRPPCGPRRRAGQAARGVRVGDARRHAAPRGRCRDGIDVLTGLSKQDSARLVRPRTEYLHQVAVMLAAYGRNREALACLADANLQTPARDWPPLVLGVVTGPIADADPMHWAVCERQRPRQPEPGLYPPQRRAD